MGINFNMHLFSLILYGSGILGILISFLFIILAIKKNTKTSSVLVVIMFVLSITLLTSGTCFKLVDRKKSSSNDIVIENLNSENNLKSIESKKPSYDDLKLNYKLGSSYNDSQKSANITIKNSSDSTFSGEINLDFISLNDQNLDSLTLKVKNLLPKKSYTSDAIVNNQVSKIKYSFSGEFNNSENIQSPYSISKISTGNNFVRINVLVNDTSKDHLEQICNVIASEYMNTNFKGILIYFYSENASKDLNLENVVADYYLNISTKTSKFTYY